ncbi:MAG: helix-turn-helix domain-containing protein [Legionella sp.]|nr:helix-turn-helix domain-containing protein [Legionella sp.]
MKNQTIMGLIEVGLTDKEALLYLTSLKKGPTTAQILSLESGLKRATVYGLIDSLIAQGLLHIEIKGVRKLFVAESPDKLASLLDKKKQILTTIMPALVQDYLHVSPAMNTIKMYHGLCGIKLLYDNILNTLKSGDEYLVISDQYKWHALDPDYFEAFIQKRATYELVIKLILQDNVHARDYHFREEHYKEKIKFLPGGMQLNMNMVIYAQNVLLVQTIEPFLAILIENANVAAMHKILFNTMWELL